MRERASGFYSTKVLEVVDKVDQLYSFGSSNKQRLSKAHVVGALYDYNLTEKRMDNILMDTGATGASYIAESFFDGLQSFMHLHIMEHGVSKMVDVGDGRSIRSMGKVQILVSIADAKGVLHQHLVSFHIIKSSAFQVVIGLPDIRRHFKVAFVDHVLGDGEDYDKNDLHDQLNLMNSQNDFVIPSDIFGEDTVRDPWTNLIEEAEEESIIPEASSFAFLGDSDYNERLSAYLDALKKENMVEYFKTDPRAVDLFANKGKQVFVYETWSGIKDEHGEDVIISIDFNKETLPKEGWKPMHIWIPPKLRDPLVKEIRRLRDLGMLTSSTSRYATNMIVAAKKTHPFIRAVGNYVRVNKHIIFAHETIPIAREEITLKMKGFAIYADLDMKNSFHQFLLDLFSSEVLTMQTPEGMFRPRFMPEGISTASGILQKYMREFLKDFDEFVIVIFDNILVLAHDHFDLTDKLHKVFDRLIRHNVVLKIEKSNIAVKKVEFFGMEVSEHGYQLTDERLQGLDDVPFPANVKGMQSFLGGMVFCSAFIPNFAQLTAPLFAMTRSKFVWDKEKWKQDGMDYEKIFQDVKQYIKQKCSLFWPDYTLVWILRTDACKFGLGSVLLQVRDGTVLEPLAFIAKSFSDTAAEWATIKQEAYAIFYSIFKLQHWFIGKPFFCQTDHANLQWIESSQEASIIRMRIFMQNYQFKIAHIRGTENKTADLMSRLLYVSGKQTVGKLHMLVEEDSEGSMELAAEHQGVVATKKMLWHDMLAASHNSKVGHFGARATYSYLCKNFPGHKIPYREVAEFVSTCGTCCKDRLGYTSEVKETIKSFSTNDYPRRMISMDLVGIGNDESEKGYINVIVNQSSKLVKLYYQKSKEAIHSARSLLLWVTQYGRFDILRSDLGSEYTDAMFNKLVEWLGLEHTYAPVHHPRADATERTVREVLRHVKAVVYDKAGVCNFDDPVDLAIVEWVMKTSFNSESGVVPLHAEYGGLDDNYLKLPNLEKLPPQDAASTYVNYVRSKLISIREIIAKRHDKISRQRTSVNTTPNYFQPGDFVWVKNYKKNYKLQPRHLGPFEVVRHDEADTNTVYMKSLVDNTETSHPVIDCHICPVVDLKEAKRLARIDTQQFAVRQIVGYRGDPQLRTTMEYLVQFEDGDEIWRPHTDDLTTNEVWRSYINGIPRLTGLSMTAEDQRKRVQKTNKLRIQFGEAFTLNKNTEVYIDMRAWGFEWYSQLPLPDLHTRTYVVRCNFTGVTKKGTKIDLQCQLLTGKKKFEMPHIFLLDECIWTLDPSRHILVDLPFIQKYPQVMSDTYTKTVRTRSKHGNVITSLMNFCPSFSE